VEFEERKDKKYLPLTDEVILSHLTGKKTIGVYPLLKDDDAGPD
jgi:hypothetical protein